MDFLNNNILNIFIILPFVYALFTGAFAFLKNPVYIRNLNKIFFVFELIFSWVISVFFNNLSANIFGYNFLLDKISGILIFLNALLFFMFVFISKTFIVKKYKSFYFMSVLLFGLINLCLLSNNIFMTFMSVFWIFLIQYFLYKKYSFNTKNLTYNLIFDIFWLCAALFLLAFDFLRYFAINNIAFEYTNIEFVCAHLSNTSVVLAFAAFLIITFKLLGFVPFKNLNIQKVTFLELFFTLYSIVLGSFLLIKTYDNFIDYIYIYRNYISLYFLLNLFLALVLNLNTQKVNKFITNSILVNISCIVFLFFSFELRSIAIYVYAIYAIVLSYMLSGFVLCILENKYHVKEFSKFFKIDDKNKLEKFLIGTSLLNISHVPLGIMFYSMLCSLLVIFSCEYDSNILNIAPYILIIGVGCNSFITYNVVQKILVEPLNVYKNKIFSNHQNFIIWILIFLIITLGVFFAPVINYFIGFLDIGSL